MKTQWLLHTLNITWFIILVTILTAIYIVYFKPYNVIIVYIIIFLIFTNIFFYNILFIRILNKSIPGTNIRIFFSTWGR